MHDETFATAADLFAAEDAARGGRKLDERATKIARLAHERGVEKLNAAFGVLPELDDDGKLKPPTARVYDVLVRANFVGDPSGKGTPVRTHPNTPPVRDAEHRAKHKRRQRVKAARRASRGS